MRETNSIVAVYETPIDTVQGVNDLNNTGFNMAKLSLVAKESLSDEHIVGYYNSGGQVKYFGRLGTLWEQVGRMLAGTAFLIVPEIGPILMSGPVVEGFVAGLARMPGARGLGSFGAGLSGLGIPADSTVRYKAELCADRLLLIAHGAPDELLRAKETLHKTRPEEVNIHFADKVIPAHR